MIGLGFASFVTIILVSANVLLCERDGPPLIATLFAPHLTR
jgi:hypothetical protein